MVSFDPMSLSQDAMKHLLLSALIPLAIASIASAQIPEPTTDGVGMGHVHLRVADEDYEEHKRILVEGLGARVANLGRLEAFLIPDTVILVARGDLQGESVGTSVNHIGFLVKDLAAAEAKWKAAGGVMLPDKPTPSQSYVELPGGTKVELSEDTSLDVPIRNHHIHLYTASDKETQAWYMEMFGVQPGTRGPFITGNVAGVEVTFANSETPVVGTQNRAIDHIGFEIENLEAFCKKLEEKGVKFDRPYRAVPQLGLSIAFFTDP